MVTVWGAAITQRGVCGNFRFKFYDITDAQSTNSVVKTDMHSVKFLSSTNTSDNADNFKAQTLSWTGTADSDVANQLADSSETFVAALTGLMVFPTSGDSSGRPAVVEFQSGSPSQLLLTSPGSKAAFDVFPAGSETYLIKNEAHVILDPVTNADDGTLFVMGD